MGGEGRGKGEGREREGRGRAPPFVIPGYVPVRRSCLKTNKVSKSEGTKKVASAYHLQKCANAVYQKSSKLVHTC